MHVVHEVAAWGRCASSAQMYLRCFYFTSQKSCDRVEYWKGEIVKENDWIWEVSELEKRDNWRCMNRPRKTWSLKGRQQLKIGMWNWQ